MRQKILVITGGGDCPGLNAVIRAVVLSSAKENWEVFGSRNAFNGILNEPEELIELTPETVEGLINHGGTIIGTTNKGQPSKFPIKKEDGSIVIVNRTNELVEKIKKLGFTAVINIGGDGSQRISQELFEKGLNIIGVPKTIDNDLAFTDFTFGFRTAVEIATDAVDKLKTTAASHQRIMILEVMGRDAGWIALNSGIAGGADIVLIPEIKFDLNKIENFLKEKLKKPLAFLIIVVAEGAVAKDGDVIAKETSTVGYEHKHLGGIGNWLKEQLQPRFEHDFRVSVLGHLQRGGSPVSFDRIIATEFGVKAVQLIKEQKFGVLTGYKYPYVLSVPLIDAITQNKNVNVDSFLMNAARSIGIHFGD
jgi:6-phosphofructokinase 1